MKLYHAPRAPNPERVRYFLQEKGAWDAVEKVATPVIEGAHRDPAYRAISPQALVPALVLEDGTALTESRAICTWLEHRFPEPNLMVVDGGERALIEMWDRRVELGFFLQLANWIRHGHPALATLETPQYPDVARMGETKARAAAAFLSERLAASPWIAGERFTIADITLHCALGFARLVKFRPADDSAAIAAWQARVRDRPGMADPV